MTELWSPLKPGDGIYIVAPASRTENALAELKICCDLIRAKGYIPYFHTDIFAEGQPLQAACGFANSDEARALDFMRALDSDCRMIWCFRGGYGSDRVAALLSQKNFHPKGSPKLLVGFSDITILHHYLHVKWQWPILHAPVLRQLGINSVSGESAQELWKILSGHQTQISFSLDPLNSAASCKQEIESTVMGGNLVNSCFGVGTAWEMPRDGIVFFEEINEAPYRIARILQHIRATGWLRDAKAIIFGDFIHGETPESAMDEVLAEFAGKISCPVFQVKGIGHGVENRPLPLATPARLSAAQGSSATLEVSAF